MPDVRTVMDLFDEPTVLVDPDGTVDRANRAACDLFHVEVEGRRLADLVEDTDDAVTERLRDLRRSTALLPFGLHVANGEGVRQLSGSGCRVSADDARVAIRLDTSGEHGEFTALTETLDRMNAEIARRRDTEARLRTLLTTTVADLESANAVLRRFASGAAHDLKSPLGTLAGFAELVATHPDVPADLVEVLERMKDTARRGIGMVDDLLAETLQAADRERPVPVDLNRVLEDVRELLGEVLAGHRLTADPLPTVLARAGAVRQVLLNLVGNAVVHHGPGPAHVHVDAAASALLWTVRVRDDGPGIAPEDRDRVFDEGERLGSPAAGSGYGLGHCRRIVEGLGGRLRFTDRDDGVPGVVACVELPAVT